MSSRKREALITTVLASVIVVGAIFAYYKVFRSRAAIMATTCLDRIHQSPEMQGTSGFSISQQHNYWTTRYYFNGFGSLDAGMQVAVRPEIEMNVNFEKAEERYQGMIYCHFSPTPTEQDPGAVDFLEIVFDVNRWTCGFLNKPTGQSYCGWDVVPIYSDQKASETKWERPWLIRRVTAIQ
jgi:hypothetical protein